MESQERQTPKKERTGLRRFWAKVKHIFEDKSQTSTKATIATNPTTISAEPTVARQPQPEPEPASAPQPELKSVPSEPRPVQPPPIEVDDTIESSPVIVEPTTEATPSQPVHIPRNAQEEAEMRFSKAQAIFARYNIELAQTDWDMRPKPHYERVPKSIRMRVRYTCHNCSTTFGHDRVCVSCHHRRCSQCSRYPAKKNRSRQPPTDANPHEDQTEPPRNHTQGACHECQTGFETPLQECPNCHHQICDRCLQEATFSLEQPPDPAVEANAAEERATATS